MTYTLETDARYIRIKQGDRIVAEQYRYAYSSRAKTAEDVAAGVGFYGKDREEAIARNAQQVEEWERMVKGLNA